MAAKKEEGRNLGLLARLLRLDDLERVRPFNGLVHMD
jgi:hypothetical protein